MTVRAIALLAALLPLLLASPAAADQRALLIAAERAEREADPRQALELYREALAAAPSARLSRRARARIAWLEARSEDDFRPLAILMRARSAPALDAAAVATLEQQLKAFPPGRVRREALVLVGDGYLRLQRPAEALAAYLACAAEPGLDEAERQLCQSGAAVARTNLGSPRDALAALRRAGLDHRPEASYARAARIGDVGLPLSLAVLAGFVAAIAGPARRAAGRLRRSRAGRWLFLALLLLGVPALFVWIYDWRLLPRFATVLAACGAVTAAASFAALGAGSSRQRRLCSYLSAMAVVAAAFVACDRCGLLLELVVAMDESR